MAVDITGTTEQAGSRQALAYPRVWRLLDILLALIIVGPLLAPLFDASGIPLFQAIAHGIIYPLGHWICPQEQHVVHVAGHITAVCTRCYAAIGGLLLVRIALSSDPRGRGIGSRLSRWWLSRSRGAKGIFIVGIIALWQLDVWAERQGWWSWDHLALVLTGPVVGLAVGFLVFGVLARLTRRAPSWTL